MGAKQRRRGWGGAGSVVLALAILVAAASFEVAGASAQPAASASVASASGASASGAAAKVDPDELFRQGGRAYDAGDFALAHSLYARAFERKATHDIAAMLAQTALKLGKPCEARAHLEHAVAHFPPSLTDERRARIERALAAVKKEVGELRVDVSPAGASVQVDFAPVPATSLPGPFCVAAGERVVFVSRPGFAVERRALVIEGAASAAIRVELRRVGEIAPAASSAGSLAGTSTGTGTPSLAGRDSPGASTVSAAGGPARGGQAGGDPARSVAFAVLAAGLAGVLAGAVLLPIATVRHDDGDALARDLAARGGPAACGAVSDFPADCARLHGLRADAAAFAGAGLGALLGGAGLGLAAGGFLVLRPSIAPDGARIALRGAF